MLANLLSLEILSVDKFEQFTNAFCSIERNALPSGMTNSRRNLHSPKALYEIFFICDGKVNVVNAVPQKHCPEILLKWQSSAKVMDCNFEQLQNAASPIAVIVEGISTLSNDLQSWYLLLVDYQYYTL